MLECVISVQFTKICRNDKSQKTPQKTHVERVQIHDATLQLVTKMEQEIIELKAKITLGENEKLSKEKEADEFFEKKRKKILLVADSHLKKISAPELQLQTGKNISLVKAFCSRKKKFFESIGR